MIGFMKSLMKIPIIWQLWLALLITVNLIVPLFYLSTLEAQLTIGALVLGFLIMSYIHTKFGYVRLLGIGHIFWFPLVLWLGLRAFEEGLSDAFAVWLVSLVVLNSLSLILDVMDVVRYLRGERAPVI